MIGPGCLGGRVRAQVELGVGDEQQLLEQLVEVELLLGGNLGELRRSAPLLRLQPFGCELGADAVEVRVRDVDLVDRDDDRDAGRASVRDRLARLRHHAVVGGDDEDRDVRDLRAAGAHGGERLVAGRVEEGDPATVSDGLVGADVLGDPAGLGLDDRRLADRVEQGRLAVVDVAHDRHDRRARGEIVFAVLEHLGLGVVVGRVLDHDLALDLGRDQLHRLVAERLGDRDHLAEAHHDLDDLRDRDPERRGEILDADAGLDGDGPGRRRNRLLPRLRAGGRTAIARLAAVAAARVAAVDDDAALAPGGASARADRAIWLVGSVGHQLSV